jgi:hypothetical protein
MWLNLWLVFVPVLVLLDNRHHSESYMLHEDQQLAASRNLACGMWFYMQDCGGSVTGQLETHYLQGWSSGIGTI